MIAPGTVAAIAASLMGNSETLDRQSCLWEGCPKHPNRQEYVRDYVCLAWEIAEETMAQNFKRTYSIKTDGTK
jgi:hypothetical protein